MNLDKQERLTAYEAFSHHAYVPIFSQPWWMDAVCGPENWDVWLCRRGDEIVAAMPYYQETRGAFRYITKAPLTQNNGIIFAQNQDATPLSRQKSEERIIDEACLFIEYSGYDVYEQQYHYSFTNWSPFCWHEYEAIPRYTFVIEDTSDLEKIEASFSSRQRKNIRKGTRNGVVDRGLEPSRFYVEHEKVFAKQGLPCPFSEDVWLRLYEAVVAHGAGEVLCARTSEGDVASLLFLIWDDSSAYLLLGGSMPELRTLETYSMLIWEGIRVAHSKGLSFDFEGSMIRRIARSYREFGGAPKLYFRIRKVFNPEVVKLEAKQKAMRLGNS